MWLQAAGYHTGLYGKYINGYNAAAPYIPPGWDEWHAFKNVAYFDYTLEENGVEVAVRQRRRRLLDRRAARPGGAVHPRRRRARQPFFLYFAPKAPHAPGDAGAAPRRQVLRHPAVAAAELQRGRRLRQAGVGPGDRALGPDQAERTRTPSTGSSSSPCRRSTRPSTALVQALRDIGQIDNTIIIFAVGQRLLVGLAPLGAEAVPVRGVHARPARDPLHAARAAAARETGFGLNIDHGVTLAELAGATPDPGVEGVSMVRLLDGTEPRVAHRLPRGALERAIPTYAEVRGVPWKYNEYVTSETELYDEARRSVRARERGSSQSDHRLGDGGPSSRAPPALADGLIGLSHPRFDLETAE